MPVEIARLLLPRLGLLPLIAALWLPSAACIAQQPGVQSVQQLPEAAIARTSATMIHVTGAVELSQGEMLLGNGSTVMAESQTVKIALTRGGGLRLCSTTALHLAEDRSTSGPSGAALMMALDRGALETSYAVGKYSDVLLTPDLRIVISGPGEAALSIRVNAQGDTCVDNHGSNAPYVTVTSQFDGGLYRVLPNQRVTFEHGSLDQVVDHETESCGCPAAPLESAESTGAPPKSPEGPGQPAGEPSSTPADTAFPIAVSAGLAPAPAPASNPVVPVGETHAEVSVPLTYNGDHPPVTPSRIPAESAAVAASDAPPAAVAPQQPVTRDRFFHRLGHFFSRIFGG
jgi:hypothetical protein